LTFDTERDYYSHRADQKLGYKEKTFKMLESAIPRLLKIGNEYKIPYTFFLCGEVAENCRDLFINPGNHTIGVHTHPFTHKEFFKGKDINDFTNDLIANYSFEDQFQMISSDMHLIQENLKIRPQAYRSGKMSHNRNTYLALDKAGLTIDCSQNPSLQIVGWQPFQIPGTSVWEIPTYCDFSPEFDSSLTKLLKISSWAESVTHNIYVLYLHPMILGNPLVAKDVLVDRFRFLIEKLLKWGFAFWTLDLALTRRKKNAGFHNAIGKTASLVSSTPIYLARKMFIKRDSVN
jgi:peptidoglycan/xylan/chitin deacetylase (PgdA/CDA1 family)